MSLFDDISKRLQKPAQQTGPQISQEEIQRTLAAKKGKGAGVATAPAASQIQAQTAEAQAEAQQKQLGLQGRIAAADLQQKAGIQKEQFDLAKQQLASKKKITEGELRTRKTQTLEQLQAGQEMARTKRTAEENMRLDAMRNQATQRLNELAANRGIKLDDIFAEFERSNQELELRKDAADLEQLGHELAMSDQAYLDELNRVGKERNLMNDISFQEELNEIILGADMANLMDELDFTRAFNADQRTWETELTKLSSGDKIDLARQMIAAEGTRQIFEGIGTAVSAGAKYGAFDASPSYEESVRSSVFDDYDSPYYSGDSE